MSLGKQHTSNSYRQTNKGESEKSRAAIKTSNIWKDWGFFSRAKAISEEDENTTDEQRKERMFRKRKCQPGWTKANYSKDPETGTYIIT